MEDKWLFIALSIFSIAWAIASFSEDSTAQRIQKIICNMLKVIVFRINK
jgi:hypothetical protein